MPILNAHSKACGSSSGRLTPISAASSGSVSRRDLRGTRSRRPLRPREPLVLATTRPGPSARRELVEACVCSHGAVFTAQADLRSFSPTFGQIEKFHLDETTGLSLFVPAGLAHGHCVLSDSAYYVFQVNAYYDCTDFRAVAWDCPDLAVSWPVADPIPSQRDRQTPPCVSSCQNTFGRWPSRERAAAA